MADDNDDNLQPDVISDGQQSPSSLPPLNALASIAAYVADHQPAPTIAGDDSQVSLLISLPSFLFLDMSDEAATATSSQSLEPQFVKIDHEAVNSVLSQRSNPDGDLLDNSCNYNFFSQSPPQMSVLRHPEVYWCDQTRNGDQGENDEKTELLAFVDHQNDQRAVESRGDAEDAASSSQNVVQIGCRARSKKRRKLVEDDQGSENGSCKTVKLQKREPFADLLTDRNVQPWQSDDISLLIDCDDLQHSNYFDIDAQTLAKWLIPDDDN